MSQRRIRRRKAKARRRAHKTAENFNSRFHNPQDRTASRMAKAALFGAAMSVSRVVEGPVTIAIDSVTQASENLHNRIADALRSRGERHYRGRQRRNAK